MKITIKNDRFSPNYTIRGAIGKQCASNYRGSSIEEELSKLENSHQKLEEFITTLVALLYDKNIINTQFLMELLTDFNIEP